MILNLKNGELSLNSYRFPDAEETSLYDVIDCYKNLVLPENIFSDNLCATVKHITLENSEYCLNVLVDNSDNLDGHFAAYDIEDKKIIFVNGWLFDWDYNSSFDL